jgi:hypothetical protein
VPTTEADDGGTSSPLGTQLTIEVDDGSGEPRTATLECGDTPAGTGHLADPAAAAAACELLASNAAARTRLVDGPPTDRMCTQQYGGPETARIAGTIDGDPVETTLNRVDGCGIADWELFAPLLG